MPPPKKQKTTAAGGNDSGSTTGSGSKNRSPNYTDLEDILLCQAYVNVTESPVRGNDMAGAPLWNKVSKVFNSLVETQKEELEAWVQGTERPPKSLEDRFKKQISFQVSRWNPFYKRAYIGKVSGTNEEDIRNEACAAYKEQYETPFKFRHCIDTLRSSPKFNPLDECWVEGGEMGPADGKKKSPAKINDTSTAMGGNLPRPIGTKAAKAELSTSSEVNKYMDRIIANNGRMQQKLDNIASTSSKKLELIQRSMEVNETTQLRKSYKFFKKMGDNGAAQEAYDRMRQIMRSERQPRSFVQTSSPVNGQSDVTVASSYDELIGQHIPGSAFI